MGRLYLVRHAQTSWNKVGRYQGREDIPLDLDGERQAGSLANFLKKENFNVIYTSPLLRAYDTAKTIAFGRRCELKTEKGLVELCYGEWEGLTRKEIEISCPELFYRWHNNPTGIKLPGGESLFELKERVLPIFYKWVKLHQEESILIVTHAAVIKVFLCHLLGLELSRYWQFNQDNCALNVVEVSGSGLPRILSVNSTAHMHFSANGSKGK